MHKSTKALTIILTLGFILTACSGVYTASERSSKVETISPHIMADPVSMNISYHYIEKPSAYVEEEPFSDEEVTAIATTLAGECYDDKLEDKCSVAEVICNRVSDGGFGDSIVAVVSAKGQFSGYWNQSRPISESDIQIAEETLRNWYANDCEKLSEYLFFCAGQNRENVFRTTF